MRHKAEAEARRARIMEDQVGSCHMFNLHCRLCLAVHSTQPVIHVPCQRTGCCQAGHHHIVGGGAKEQVNRHTQQAGALAGTRAACLMQDKRSAETNLHANHTHPVHAGGGASKCGG